MNNKLVSFVREARNKGYSDLQIKKALFDYNWPIKEINSAFSYLKPKFRLKNQICIFLSNELIQKLEKRSKKSMLTLSEQIEDILRRSCLSQKSTKEEKLDDTLIALFSRKRP